MGNTILLGIFMNIIFGFTGYPIPSSTSSQSSFDLWVSSGIVNDISTMLKLYSIFLILIALAAVVAIIAAMTQKQIEPKKSRPAMAWENIVEITKKLVTPNLVVYFLVLGAAFIIGRGIQEWTESSFAGETRFDYGWWRFTVGAILMYFVLGLYVLLFSLRSIYESEVEEGSVKNEKTAKPEPNGLITSTILVLVFSLFVLPVYSAAIYPFLPPQIGGGAPIPIQLIAKYEVGMTLLADQESLYLLDRTQDEVLVMVNYENGTQAVYGIPLDEIAFIGYLP